MRAGPFFGMIKNKNGMEELTGNCVLEIRRTKGGEAMEDREIIRLYQKRDEQAISASRSKYGAFLYGIAMNILHQNQDAEECESDTYHNAWRHIPPDNPWALRTYLGKITRRLSISRYRKNHAEKRNSEMELLLEELDQCIPDSSTPEQSLEVKELGEIISNWLIHLPEQQKKLFVRRYWFGDSLEQLSREFELPRGLISQRLSRMRSKLKVYLEQQGVSL